MHSSRARFWHIHSLRSRKAKHKARDKDRGQALAKHKAEVVVGAAASQPISITRFWQLDHRRRISIYPALMAKIIHSPNTRAQSCLRSFSESNHCPASIGYEGRIKQLYEDYKSKGMQLVAINPNNASAVRLNELGYTDMTDSLPEMKVRAAYRHIEWPYLYDGETQSVAIKFGASATPHLFIFDQDRKLRYEGHIDDSLRESNVKATDARNAIEALLAGQPVPVASTRAFGCSTKWLSKAGDVQAEWTKIQAEPVKVDPAGADDLKKLRANASTGKVVVVSFWSTKCKDCLDDFKAMETTNWMYRGRDFSFVTVSTDRPSDSATVLKILQDQHAEI